jgi:hypothetical protein
MNESLSVLLLIEQIIFELPVTPAHHMELKELVTAATMQFAPSGQ